jgi:hypothetical protein
LQKQLKLVTNALVAFWGISFLDDYYVSLKEYSCHINRIFDPCGRNNFIYMENIWLKWQEYFSQNSYIEIYGRIIHCQICVTKL